VYAQQREDAPKQSSSISPDALIGRLFNFVDLGEYEAEDASFRPSLNAQGAGFDYNRQQDDMLFKLSPKYSRQNGFYVSGALATAVSSDVALGVIFDAGAERNAWLVNSGFAIDDHQRVIFSLGQLRQKLDFNFISGTDKTQITQNNIAFSYHYLLGNEWLNSAEFNSYISDTLSVNLADKTYFTDTPTLYELWNDPRRIAGGRVEGGQARLVMTPSQMSKVNLGLGAERLRYDLLVGSEQTIRPTASVELTQKLYDDYTLTSSANLAASQDAYAVGFSKSLGNSSFGANISVIRGHQNSFNDNLFSINFTHFFGGNGTSRPHVGEDYGRFQPSAGSVYSTSATKKPAEKPAAETKEKWTSNLLSVVAERPSFLPSQVNAKIDTSSTPTRLIAINKAGLPTDSTIENATGILTVPIKVAGSFVPVSGIASITKNSASFTNAGQFSISATTYLVLNPSLLAQPATSDVYVVTMNNVSGGGTTLATITTSRGSTKIDSVVIASGASADSSLSALALSSGTLSPAFASGTTSYTASVTNATASMTVTPTKTNANASITVNGVAVPSGNASGAIALSVGANTITTVVTAEDTTTTTYTVTVLIISQIILPPIWLFPGVVLLQ